jgi:hypothetical protein
MHAGCCCVHSYSFIHIYIPHHLPLSLSLSLCVRAYVCVTKHTHSQWALKFSNMKTWPGYAIQSFAKNQWYKKHTMEQAFPGDKWRFTHAGARWGGFNPDREVGFSMGMAVALLTAFWFSKDIRKGWWGETEACLQANAAIYDHDVRQVIRATPVSTEYVARVAATRARLFPGSDPVDYWDTQSFPRNLYKWSDYLPAGNEDQDIDRSYLLGANLSDEVSRRQSN